MTQVSIRELTHGFSGYLKAVKKGERIIILQRHVPVAELIPHQVNVVTPGWKRPIQKIKCKTSLSGVVSRMREQDR